MRNTEFSRKGEKPLQESATSRHLSVEAKASRLHSLLSPILEEPQLSHLSGVILRNQYSLDTISARLGALSATIGTQALPIILRRSPRSLYSCSTDFDAFLKRQSENADSARAILDALSEAGISGIQEDVLEKILMHPVGILSTIIQAKESFPDWKERLREIAGPGASLFLKKPGQQKQPIIKELEQKEQVAETAAMRERLLSELSVFVRAKKAGQLVGLYVEGIKCCSASRALDNLQILRQAGTIRNIRATRPAWTDFFNHFEHFMAYVRTSIDELGKARVEIIRLVGPDTAKLLTPKASLERLKTIIERLDQLKSEFGEAAMLDASKNAPRTLSGTHFNSWLSMKRQAAAATGQDEALMRDNLAVFERILGQGPAAQLYGTRSLSERTIGERIATLAREHPDEWEKIIRRSPSTVLSCSDRRIDTATRGFLYAQARTKHEKEVRSELAKHVGPTKAESLMAAKTKRCVDSETVLGRLAEIELLPDTLQGAVFSSNCTFLLRGSDDWDVWLKKKKLEARFITLLESYAGQGRMTRRLVDFFAKGSHKLTVLSKIEARIYQLAPSGHDEALVDAMITNWRAVSRCTEPEWVEKLGGMEPELARFSEAAEKVSRKYEIIVRPSVEAGFNRFPLIPNAGVILPILGVEDGEPMIRRSDLHVLKLYIGLHCLKNQESSMNLARFEIDQIKKKAVWNVRDRMRLWMLRSFAPTNKDSEKLTQLNSPVFVVVWEHPIRHPDYYVRQNGDYK